MSEIKRVKIGSIIESQIPEFLSVESPLFVEFLKQYYQSLEHQSGSVDIISNITQYKNSKKFNNIDLIEQTTLTSDILSFDSTINVESTKGWPDTYGLLKINDEIITYLSKTETSFENCIRGFSGIENIESLSNPHFLQFSSTNASEHNSGTIVQNLSNLFLVKFFEKFKFEFLPGFESRDFYENISIENIAYRIKDLYASKGTDQSYKLLFKILYGSDIEIIKPQQYTLSPSSNSYFITKNILVEKISGGNPIDIKGNFLFQNIPGIGTVSASIFNVEYRPVGGKQFYEISLDSTSFSGNFQVSGKTRILEDVQVNSDTILVDSTVGFANSGTILVKPKNSDFIEINYTGKNVNQFTGVTNVTKPLDFGLDLIEEKFAFSYVGVGNTSLVEFRVINVIDNIDFSNTSNLRVGDNISLSGFGKDLYDQYEFNSWIYNIPTNHSIRSISKIDSTKYRINLFDKIYFYQNERILLVDNLGNTAEVDVISVEYSTSDLIKKYSNRVLVQTTTSPSFNILNSTIVRKKIYKANHYSNYFENLENITSGVQNTYIDSEQKYFYVTSSGLPNYTIFSTDNKKIVSTTAGIARTDTFNVLNHNFLSGELIYYQPDTSSGIITGLYYVTKVDNNRIKLSYSKSDIFSKKYIQVTSPISNDVLYKSGYQNKTVKHQKLLKKFSFNREKSSFDDLNERTTFNREIGLLVNGVELLSPTLFDENIYYGNIKSIDVTNAGRDYDVIDVPPLEIKDETGTGVKAHLNISGTVREIKILNAGYGYQEKPKITITGGNGVGCVLESNFVKSKVSAGFKADINVNTIENTIQFLNSIPFEDGEEIIYDSNKNSNIPGIVDNSVYFVGILTDNKVKLYNTKTDALQKINEIDFVGISSGFHFISTLKNKNTFTKIYVKNPGQGYSNRKVTIPSVLSGDNRTSGINTFDSYIFAKNHGFKDSELVKYSAEGSPISGLSTSIYYHVKVIDVNKFRLYEAGIGTTLNNDNYLKNKFTKFNSLGSGTHTIGYPPIQIHVESKSSIGSTTTINTELKPIVLGSIEDVYLENGGIGYGCTDIVNYHRRPNVGIASVTAEAILKPIIIDGSIVDVQIINRGQGFRQNSEIIVSGDGNYAQLEPIVEDGKLSNINIVFGGVGYKSSNTILTLKNRGQDAKFLANVNEWKINQIVKCRNIISAEDDGILHASKNPNLELQFINFYVPKKLRYQLSDNFTDSNKENTGILNHSPILGYAYDGNPIYGPYSYDTTTGGFIRRMNSGYVLNVNFTPGLRPPSFESGFFIDDYQYDGSGDLDQHNGRFCITPEYPNGTYAYFTTIDVNASNVSIPRYPYVVGPYFYNKPVIENFLPLYNQDVNIFTTNLTRNVGPYYLNRTNSYYDLIDKVSDEYKQEFYVTSINSGKIEDVSIFSPGDNYKINDPVDIDISDTEGIQSNIVVSELDGREIESFTLSEDLIESAEFFVRIPNTIVKTTAPHGIKNGQPILISGISTITSSKFEGIKYAEVSEKESQLLNDIDSTIVTGSSTFITLKDINGFKVNDFIGIGSEVLLITNIDTRRSGFYVNRLQNTGIHTAGIDNVILLPREFKIPTGDITDLNFENYTTFFDPKFDVGIGTTGSTRTVVGFGSTSFETRFIPARSIYLPSHKFYTGQPLIYNSGSGFDGFPLYVNNVGSASSFRLEDNQVVYAVNLGKDYIGLSTIGFTSSIGIGTNLKSLEFWDQTLSYGVIGAAHSLTTLNPKITGTIEKVLGVVTTSTNHNLQVDDIITLNLTTSYNEVVKVIFDPVNRKVLMREIVFSDSDVSVSNNSINVSSYDGNIETGDKVVYVSNSPIGGLTNYGVYYVLKTDFNSIKLCQYKSDISESNFIDFSSAGGSTQKLYFINPQISCVRTTKIEFDLSDSSLLNLDLQFYFDANFVEKINERTGFFVDRRGVPGNSGAKVILDLSGQFFPIYYNLFPKGSLEESKKQISSDDDVNSHNKISIINHQLNDKFKLVTSSDRTFSFFNTKKLTFIEKQILNQNTTKFSYKTNSTTALGPISKLKINFPGRGYKKLPNVREVRSSSGTNAVIKLISPNIGRVETFSRVKDGFDYPTDPTLSPALSVPTVIGVKDIRTIDYIGIITGGKRYNSPPKLIVKNDETGIELTSKLSGGSVTSVDVIKNSTSLSAPLEIIPIYNSNGYEIDSISVSGSLVTLELTNNPGLNPFISSGFGKTDYVYPFEIGDKIFIENCRLTDSTSSQANFNSSSYNYTFFDVVGINTTNNTITYDMTGISTGSFGTYNDELNLGIVINKNDMPQFEMILKDDVSYISNENISSQTFSGTVMENGWDNNLNQLRLKNISGEINIGDKIFGETSKINGTVEYFDVFNLYATLGVSRDKTSSIDFSSGISNDYLQRISDNFYYQKFSYSIKGNIPYNIWRESVRSILHPSGFKEFSDLEIFTKPTLNEVNLGIAKSSDMKPRLLATDSFTFVNVDQIVPLNVKKNFARVYEEELLPDGSIQDIYLDQGIDLSPYIINKTNKVIEIDDISSQFDGRSEQYLQGRFADASDLLELNREFIQEEVVGFITATYPGITTNPDWDRTICKRDVGYVVDAIAHDVKYGSNNKSIEAGLAYWSGLGTSYVQGETTETIEGFKYIVNLSKYIINNVGVKTSYQLANPVSISSAFYNNVTGITTITTTSPHGLSTTTTNYVVLKNIVFSCNSGGGINTAIFPNTGNGPDGNGPLSPKGFVYQVEVIDSTRFRVNPGPSTIAHTYVSGGTIQRAFISTTQYTNSTIIADTSCNPTYNENCCADVWSSISNYVGIITSIIGIGTTSKPETIIYPSLTRGGSVVGLTTFKLKNKGTSLFRHEFTGSSVNINNDVFTIPNHNFQSGQELSYSYSGGSPVGIATTSYVTGQLDALLNVHQFDGSAIFENGYNVAITTSNISGTVPNSTPFDLTLYSQVIGLNTTGLGTDARFNVLISYNGSGIPVGTSIVLTYGGSGYYVGEQVSISGTYFGGTTPANDLSFVVSATGPTVIQSEANQSYLSVPSNDLSGATFNVYRDSSGAIGSVKVLNGGFGYDSNSIISIASTYIGGTNPKDDLSFSPLELGSKVLPPTVFVYKLNDNQFKLSGLSTSVFLNLNEVGTATHYLSYKEPNSSVIITIDGIIQKAVTRKSLNVSLGSSVSSASTTILDISSGISSLSVRDIINIDNEYVSIRNIGITSENQIEVIRGYFGTVATSHTIGAASTVLTGDFNIIGDVVYFDTAPYGKIGPVGLETGSIFGGRVFSRKFDPTVPNDKNILFDDISLSFTGIAATEFTLKTSGQTTDTVFNNVNSSTEINNNPIILINNVFQDPTSDYTVDGSGTNVLRFLSGTPSSGKISKVSISNNYGYVPRIGAAASAVVSAAGTISNVIVIGSGSGYRSSPSISIASTIGFGASIVANVSAAGTISGFTIINPGSGYTSTSIPEVVIGIPTGYSNLSLGYTGGSSGVGQNAKVTVEVGMGSSIISYKFDQPGVGYKVGDKLSPIGIFTSSAFRYDSLNINNVQYDNITGITTIVTDSVHNINENDYVILSGIAFTCGYDEVGIQTFSYDNATGICTVTTYSPHGLLRTDVDSNKTSNEVFLYNLPFSCAAEHSGVTTTIFPDGTSSYGRVFPVLSSVGLNTFTMNAGISTIPHVFEGWPEIGITTFSYYQVTGLSTVTTTIDHEFEVGDKITLSGLAFTCNSSYTGLTTTIFPDGTSQYGYTFTVTAVNSSTEFEFLAGISTIVHYYNGGGYTKKVPTAQRVLRYTDESTDGVTEFRVVSVASTNTFEVLAGSISTIPHYYTQGGIVTFKKFEPFILTVEEVEKDSFSGFYPGQFIQFNDISEFFNGFRKKFTLSTTVNGLRQVVGLRVPEGSDLDITNNIFIYINDVLQIPNVSYTFSGSRVVFKEAPKAGSKCVILYYRGSSLDVELIDPPKTIKTGDIVTIQENPLDQFDVSQFDRVVKKITSSDQLETFNYYSVGIITDSTKIRPLTWQKQLNDTVINGTLYSKSRPSLQSNIKPFATIIKKIEPDDSVIYVDNAYPLFSDLDNLSEDLRDALILENRDIQECLAESTVSTSSTISSINIIDGGIGYANTQSPKVVISETYITKKDPIFNWTGASGISTAYDLKSIKYKDKFISVGNNSIYSTSYDGINWQVSTVGFGPSSNFNSVEVVGVGASNFVVSVGNLGQIIKATDYGNAISSWSQIPLLEDVVIPGFGAINRVSSGYTGTFNEIVYSNTTDTWVTVGAGGSIFVGTGVGTDSFVNRFSETLSDLNSVTFGAEYFVAVGNDGVIRTSNDGNIWEFVSSPVNNNLNKVIYANGKFIAVGDYGTILQSVTRNTYQSVSNNLGIESISNIHYSYGFYVIITSVGDLYYSFDLSNWIYRSTSQANFINDLIFVDNIGADGRYVAIGSGATAIYSEPVYNRATAISNVTAGVVTSIEIVNGGFGYDLNNPPPVIVESDSYNSELIKSFKVIGDHGIIIGVTTYISGTPGIGTNSPKISFTLKSEQYDNSTLGIGYSSLNIYGVTNSQLSKGDYFVITDSNVETGGDLVGITTLLGGMSNYPNSKVGVAKSFIDGVYIVEDVTSPILGIVTVTCNFAPMVDDYVKVYARGANNTGVGTNNYYGRYSWAKIYDYQNRILGNPKTFEVFNDNGISGISSSPKIIRTRSVISK